MAALKKIMLQTPLAEKWQFKIDILLDLSRVVSGLKTLSFHCNFH